MLNMKKITQFKSKSREELSEDLVNIGEQLRKVRLDLAFNKQKNVKLVFSLRKDIARIKTLLNEK